MPDLRELARATTVHDVSGGAIVYLPARQRLYALNEPASIVWRSLADNLSDPEIEAGLAAAFSLSSQTARAWFAEAARGFAATIAVDASARDDVPPRRPGTAPPERLSPGADYRILDQHIRIAASAAHLSLIDELIGHLRLSDPADRRDCRLWIEVVDGRDGLNISSSNDPPVVSKPAGLVAEIERLIVQDIVPATSHFLAFHAALLQREATSILLPAPSGSGKTSLSIALHQDGWVLASDEMALLDRALDWRGLPFPPCVKEESFARMQQRRVPMDAASLHERYGRRVKYPTIPIGEMRCGVGIVVFPRFDRDARLQLRQIQPFEGLQRLLKACVYVPPGFTGQDVGLLLDWHRHAVYAEIDFPDAWSAASELTAFVNGNTRRSTSRPS